MFWSLRTFETRKLYITTLLTPFEEYMDEKIDTHKLNGKLKCKPTLFGPLLSFIILLSFYLRYKNYSYELKFNMVSLVPIPKIIVVYFSKANPWVQNHEIFKEVKGHKGLIRELN